MAVRKLGGYKKITAEIIKGIIKAQGLDAPAKDAKSETTAKTLIPVDDSQDVVNPKIIINKKLQRRIRASLFELIKQDHLHNKQRPASQKSFEAALNIMLDDIFDFLYGHYDEIYED